jgi:hypothetical protein
MSEMLSQELDTHELPAALNSTSTEVSIEESSIDWKMVLIQGLLLTIGFDIGVCGGRFLILPMIAFSIHWAGMLAQWATQLLTNVDLLCICAATSWAFWLVRMYRRVALNMMLTEEISFAAARFLVRKGALYATFFLLVLPTVMSWLIRNCPAHAAGYPH